MVGLLSLQPGSNLFVAPGGQWLGAYIPAVWRGYPFRVLPAEGDESSVLCVDEASEWIVNADEAEAVWPPEAGLFRLPARASTTATPRPIRRN